MRRHPTVTEKPDYHINYNLLDEKELAGWTSKGKTSLHTARKKKSWTSKNRESSEVYAMAASVLPTGNAYNDYNDCHVKYHSVSGGSALSQSMIYAEAWLYGSLSVKPSPVRTALLNFDYDIGGQGFVDRVKNLPGCVCTTRGCPHYASTLTCDECAIPVRRLNNVQTIGTVRAKSGSQVHFYRPLQQYVSDPYDLVRQSRLGSTKNLPNAVRSHSPYKRKLVLAVDQELVQCNETTRKSGNRRSILDCDINPYDQVAKVRSVEGDNSDDELADALFIKSSKKPKPIFKNKIKMKLQDVGVNKLKNKKKAGKAIVADSAHGISIAGQKIKIFNTSNKVAVGGSEDWISDPSISDEPEPPNKVAERLEAPKRPPRKKIVSSGILKKNLTGGIAPMYENCEEVLSQKISCHSRGVAITSNTWSMTTNYGDVKSILKKPLNRSSTDSETSGRLEPLASGIPCSEPLEYRTCSSKTDGWVSGAAGAERYAVDANLHRTDFSHYQQSTRSAKVKKQVQFKAMQERTTEDESGFGSSLPHDVRTSTAADLQALSLVDEAGCTASETIVTTIATTTTTKATQTNTLPVSTPMSQCSDAEGQLDVLQVYDDSSNDARPTSRGEVDANWLLDLNSSSSPVFMNECLVVSPTAKSSFSCCGSVCGSTAKCASDCTSDISKDPNGVLEPVSHLRRTLSECLFPRPLLARMRCEAFEDTVRLRVRCNSHIESRRLFCSPNTQRDAHDKLPQQAHKICSRPAIPPPLPPCVPNITTSVPNLRLAVPQLPPRQYFACSKSDRQNVNTANENAVANNKVDEIRILSLTQTLLQHRTYPSSGDSEKENSPYHSGSVIKIKVTSRPEDVSAQPQNRTIVTITPAECPDVPLTQQQVSNCKTCVTINVNEDSPLNAPAMGSGSNAITTINVGYDESKSTPLNDFLSKSNLLVNTGPNSNTMYVKSPQSSALNTTETEKVFRQELGSGDNSPVEASVRVCTCNCGATSIRTSGSSSNGGSSNSSLLSVDSAVTEMSPVKESNDFSVHYMSCRIDEQLTEDKVGLTRKLQENEYESAEPIYEEISETPPPLPLGPPPDKVDDIGIVIPPKSIFEGASKYDILKYLASAKERCKIPEEPCPRFVIEEVADLDATDLPPAISHARNGSLDLSSHHSHLSNVSDSSDELTNFLIGSTSVSSVEKAHKNCTDIERNDSGVGSETSKCSRSKWQHHHVDASSPVDQQLMCEDCEQPVETQLSDGSWTYAYVPLVCCKCSKKRIERREIIAEVVETEVKYGRDLRIILDEFYQPMLVAGLLTPEQLSSIFLNVEELWEHNRVLAEKLRDGYEIAVEQGDEDLLTFNMGKIFLDAGPMLHAFESYCTRQGNAALLLANLEKDKELLKIFLRVSQMENTVLRRMNLNSFLMVPVQRVTKYPLLLARLYKVTPDHLAVQRELLKEAQHNIELHLEHINSLTKDIGSMKIWRRISMMNGRRVSCDADDIVNIKLQKIAVEVLEWGHEEVRFAMEGRLLYAQPTDYNWKRTGRTIKVVSVNALLVTLGKPTENHNVDCENQIMFPPKNGIRDASLLLMKEKGGKYSLVRDPLFLDHCIIYCDSDCDEYFEVQEIPTKDTYIFKAEDEERTRQWYKQLQYHSQGLGCWRKRRNALANIMINGMQVRS